MKTWKLLLPISLAAGAAALLLKKKLPRPGDGERTEEKKAPSAEAMQHMQEGQYEFISGYDNARHVTVCIPYDAARFAFSVLSEDYPAVSAASHVALLSGEEYQVQMEYAAFYQGEDFDLLAKSSEGKYKDFRLWRCGENEGFSYLDGDDWRVAVKIPGDNDSYLLVTALRLAAEAEDFAQLPDEAVFRELLAQLRFTRQN